MDFPLPIAEASYIGKAHNVSVGFMFRRIEKKRLWTN